MWRRLLVRVLKWRRGVLRANQDRLLTVMEKYGGIAQPETMKEWRDKLSRVQRRLEDVEARLGRAQ